MELDNILSNGLDRYFNTLGNVGYISDNRVFKLWIYLFIAELLDNEFASYITEGDYEYIVNALECLTDCMIDRVSYREYNDKIYDKNLHLGFTPRKSMGNVLRISEDSMIRKV